MIISSSRPDLFALQNRDHKSEGGSSSDLALEIDGAAVSLHNAQTDRQSQTVCLSPFRGEEGIKDVRPDVGRYPDAFIPHKKLHLAPVAAALCSNDQRAAFGHGLLGIHNQVDKHLFNLHWIDLDRRQIVLDFTVAADVAEDSLA
jgi:hypothetical protein